MSRTVSRVARIARRLRRSQTDAERMLWTRLRNRRLAGARFRRQYPVGRGIADFACPELRLIIEVDGGQHADSARDCRRDRLLASLGWRVLRFWNNDVLKRPDAVLQVIHHAVLTSSPQPSPENWRGSRNSLSTCGEGGRRPGEDSAIRRRFRR